LKIITVKHCFNITVSRQEKVGKNPLPVFTGVEEQKYINTLIYYACSIKRLYLILATRKKQQFSLWFFYALKLVKLAWDKL